MNEYKNFPFGKYKGVELDKLPINYIVFALDKFDLPDELHEDLLLILLGKLKVFTWLKTYYHPLNENDILWNNIELWGKNYEEVDNGR